MGRVPVITPEQYLRNVLQSRKWELETAKMNHRIYLAEHDITVKLLQEQIDSVENYLDSIKKEEHPEIDCKIQHSNHHEGWVTD
jgi:hypothetical protein